MDTRTSIFVNSLDDETWWLDEPWRYDGGGGSAWCTREREAGWQQPQGSEPTLPPAVFIVTATTQSPFRQQVANRAATSFTQHVDTVVATTRTLAQETLPAQQLHRGNQGSTRSVSWIQPAIPFVGLSIRILLYGVHNNDS